MPSEEFIEPVAGEFHGIRAEIVNHRVWGHASNALVVKLPGPCEALSSRDGLRTVDAVCNCYLPESLWPVFHETPEGWPSYLEEILALDGLSADRVTALSTGVNMKHLAWHSEIFEELRVLAFVTAGVSTNAMRIGMDKAGSVERNGAFDRIGTINTILLTESRLALAPMSASFITATEAKNIALQDMEVRSTYTPRWQATGTGTDQIVTVSGHGDPCVWVGGHTKLGEMIATAVTSATVRAIRNTREAGV